MNMKQTGLQTTKIRKAPGSLGIVWKIKRSRVLPGILNDRGCRNVAIVQSKQGPAAAEAHLNVGDKLVAVISSKAAARKRIPVVDMARDEILELLEGYNGEAAVLEFLKAGEICPDEDSLFAPSGGRGANTFTVRIVREPRMTQSYFSETEPARNRTRSHSLYLPASFETVEESHLAWELRNAQQEQESYFKEKAARRESRVKARIERMRRLADEAEEEELKTAQARGPVREQIIRRTPHLVDTGLALREAEDIKQRLSPAADLVARAELGEWRDLRRLSSKVPGETWETVKVLNMDGLHLQHVPDHVAHFRALRELYLANNQIKELPAWIGELQQLEVLNLSNNLLEHLPLDLGRLRNTLQQLSLERNPELVTPPHDLLEQCVALRHGYVEPLPILEYLAQCALASEWNLHFTVTVVGEAESGKTSLVRCLLRSKAEQILFTDRTLGVEMIDWFVYHEQMSIRLIDVSGQASYKVSNHLFFLQRSLFVYVWRAAPDHGEDSVSHEAKLKKDLARWLWQLQVSVPKAEVLLVVTHVDCVDAATLARLQDQMRIQAMRFVKEAGHSVRLRLVCEGRSFTIDCRTGLGVRDIREQIYEFCKHRDMYRGRVPKSLHKLRDKLDNAFKAMECLNYDSVRELAASCEVSGEPWLESAMTLMTKMGHLMVLQLPGRGRDRASLFVSPQWLTRVLARLFQHDRTLLAATLLSKEKKKSIRHLVALDLRGELNPELASTLWPMPITAGKTRNGENPWAVQRGTDDVHAVLCQNSAVIRSTIRLLEGLDLLQSETKTSDEEVLRIPALDREWSTRITDQRIFYEWDAPHCTRFVYRGAFGPPDGLVDRMLLRVQRLREGHMVRHPQAGLSIYRMGTKTSVWVSCKDQEWTINVRSTLRSEMEAVVMLVADFDRTFPGLEKKGLEFFGRIGEWVSWPVSEGRPKPSSEWRSMTSGDKDTDVGESLAKLSLVQQRHALVFLLHSGSPLWPSRTDFELDLDKSPSQQNWDPPVGSECMAYRHAGRQAKSVNMHAGEVVGGVDEDHVQVKFRSDHVVQTVPRLWLHRDAENMTERSVHAIGNALARQGISFDDRDDGPFNELRVALLVIDPSFEWSTRCRRCVKAIMESRMPSAIAVLSGENGDPPRANSLNAMFGMDIRQHPHLFDCRTPEGVSANLPDMVQCIKRRLASWREPNFNEPSASLAVAQNAAAEATRKMRGVVKLGIVLKRHASTASMKALDDVWEPPHPHLDGVVCPACRTTGQSPPHAFKAETVYDAWAAASRGEASSKMRCEKCQLRAEHVTEVLSPEAVVSYCLTAGPVGQQAAVFVQNVVHKGSACCCWAFAGDGEGAGTTDPGSQGRLLFVRMAKVVLVLLSDEYVTTDQCRAELREALDNKLEIIPVLLPPSGTNVESQSKGWQGPATGLWWTHAQGLHPGSHDLWSALQMFPPVDLRSPGAMHISSSPAWRILARTAAALSDRSSAARLTAAKYAAWHTVLRLESQEAPQELRAARAPLGDKGKPPAPSPREDFELPELEEVMGRLVTSICSVEELELAALEPEMGLLLTSISEMWAAQLRSDILSGESLLARLLRQRLRASLGELTQSLSPEQHRRVAFAFALFAREGGIARAAMPAALALLSATGDPNDALHGAEAVPDPQQRFRSRSDFDADPPPVPWDDFRALGAARLVDLQVDSGPDGDSASGSADEAAAGR